MTWAGCRVDRTGVPGGSPTASWHPYFFQTGRHPLCPPTRSSHRRCPNLPHRRPMLIREADSSPATTAGRSGPPSTASRRSSNPTGLHSGKEPSDQTQHLLRFLALRHVRALLKHHQLRARDALVHAFHRDWSDFVVAAAEQERGDPDPVQVCCDVHVDVRPYPAQLASHRERLAL